MNIAFAEDPDKATSRAPAVIDRAFMDVRDNVGKLQVFTAAVSVDVNEISLPITETLGRACPIDIDDVADWPMRTSDPASRTISPVALDAADKTS